jgi:NitT/TauT family transport system substrate-binding protein
MPTASRWVIVVAVVIVLVTAGALTYYYYVQTHPKPLQKVNFMMDFFIYGAHSIFFPAISEGYYNKTGLDVSIVPGQGSYATVQAVGSGAATFGFANTAAAMIAISKGVPIRIIGMINYYAPCAIITLSTSGITTPKDLQGRKLGGEWGTGACETLFPGFASETGINISTVSEATLSGSSELPALLAGTVDAVVGFSSGLYLWQSAAAAAGKQLQSLNWTEYGFNIYGNAIITNNQTINSDPDLVSRFLSATYQGIFWAYKNQTGTAQIFTKYNPSVETYNVTVGLTHWTFDLWNQTVINEAVSSNNPLDLGFMTLSKMQETFNWTVTYQNVTSFPVQEAFTNQFL